MRIAFRMQGLILLVLLLVDGGRIWAEPKEMVRRGEPLVQKFEEVERGFWVRSFFGISISSQNPYKDKSRKNPAWPPGGMLGVEVGLDLGQVASVHLAACGLHLFGNRIIGEDKSDVANDVGVLLLMMGSRFNVATTKRTAWFFKAGAGYMIARPKEATLDDGLVVQAGAGFEYATNLRHFYAGLEIGADYFFGSEGFVSTITPTLKYTF